MPPIHKANTLLPRMSPPVNRDYCQKQDRDNDQKKLNHFFRVHVNPLVYCLPLLTVTGCSNGVVLGPWQVQRESNPHPTIKSRVL